MKTITINNKSEVTAEGNLSCFRCKPVVCIDTFKIFTSVTDAAAYAGCVVDHMVNHLKGKFPKCKGKTYKYLSEIEECLDVMFHNAAELKADAEKWRAQQAAQEAARLAEEKRIADIAKAEEKVAHYCALSEKHHQQYLKAVELMNEAERELHNLRGE